MTLEASIRKFSSQLEKLIVDKDWAAANVCRERLKVILLDAISDGSEHAVGQIEASLGRVRGLLVFQFDADTAMSANAVAWLVAADAETARISKRKLPVASRTMGLADGSVRERILNALANTQKLGLTNSVLANRTNASVETIARILRDLRQEGRVSCRRVGRTTINRLTASLDPWIVQRTVKEIIRNRYYGEQPDRIFTVALSSDLNTGELQHFSFNTRRHKMNKYQANVRYETPNDLVGFQSELTVLPAPAYPVNLGKARSERSKTNIPSKLPSIYQLGRS